MSSNAFGTVWNQGYMLPVSHGTQSGEAFPKRVPPDGCGFNGLPGDFPAEKRIWYTREFQNPASGASCLKQRGRNSGNQKLKAFASSTSAPALPELRGPEALALAPEAFAPDYRSYGQAPGGKEVSHSRLYYGRERTIPETLRTAGVSTFKFRRYQETNTSSPFL
mmetsp:Transcript_81533/g.147242  ORF Transcript_81533/g.147242 Transcript_81533/m.147242 type:complete len:165 (-) Transcript_81533:65-559(-)